MGTDLTPENEEVVLRCKCGLPFAMLKDGVVIIQAKHHGRVHVNTVTVAELLRLVAKAKEVKVKETV